MCSCTYFKHLEPRFTSQMTVYIPSNLMYRRLIYIPSNSMYRRLVYIPSNLMYRRLIYIPSNLLYKILRSGCPANVMTRIATGGTQTFLLERLQV